MLKLTKIKSLINKTLGKKRVRQFRGFLKRLKYGSNLEKLAVAFGTDKHGSHFYAQHYKAHFSKFRKKEIVLIEIGVGGYSNPLAGGESLRMWKAFFPNATIYGIDIYDKSYSDEPRIKTFQGSQIDFEFLANVIAETGPPDIIIDDGSHINDHVIKTFHFMFPKLKENGVYVIEDLQTSYWTNVGGQEWGGSEDLNAKGTSVNFLKSLIDCLNYEEFMDNNYKPNYYDRNIKSLHFYHNLAFIYKGKNEEGSNIFGKRF